MVRNCRRLSRVGGEADAAGDRRVERVPDEVAQLDRRAAPAAASPGGGISTCSRARKTSVPKTRRIGCAKLPAVYCVAGLGSGKPQSQAGARRSAREARRWIGEGRERRRDGDEDEDQQPIVGAAALGDRHDREPRRRRPAPACGRRPAPATTGASASMTRPGRMPASEAERGEARTSRRARSGRPRAPLRPPACAAGRGR